MINELVFVLARTLYRAEFAASAAILVALLIRLPARRLVGAGLAYRLWSLPLAAAVASLFPSLREMRNGPATVEQAMSVFDVRGGIALLMVWFCGAGVVLGAMALCELRFRRRAAQGLAGPAVAGLGWHRLVIPSDFRHRFSEVERDFILRHERAHIARRDPLANLLIALLQAVSWFNPLVHIAAAAARLDQELACDEAVIRDRPDIRRGYAQTLLKAHLSKPSSPFACAFVGGRHPLELRLAMLAQPQPGLARYLLGLSSIAALAFLTAAAVWAASPEGRPSASLPWASLSAIITGLSASG